MSYIGNYKRNNRDRGDGYSIVAYTSFRIRRLGQTNSLTMPMMFQSNQRLGVTRFTSV